MTKSFIAAIPLAAVASMSPDFSHACEIPDNPLERETRLHSCVHDAFKRQVQENGGTAFVTYIAGSSMCGLIGTPYETVNAAYYGPTNTKGLANIKAGIGLIPLNEGDQLSQTIGTTLVDQRGHAAGTASVHLDRPDDVNVRPWANARRNYGEPVDRAAATATSVKLANEINACVSQINQNGYEGANVHKIKIPVRKHGVASGDVYFKYTFE